MIFFCVLIFLVFAAQIAEFFIPPLDWMSNAHVYITPVLVFYGAMALPLPLLLVLVFWAGFLLDALTAQVIGGRVEISFGSSILLFWRESCMGCGRFLRVGAGKFIVL